METFELWEENLLRLTICNKRILWIFIVQLYDIKPNQDGEQTTALSESVVL